MILLEIMPDAEGEGPRVLFPKFSNSIVTEKSATTCFYTSNQTVTKQLFHNQVITSLRQRHFLRAVYYSDTLEVIECQCTGLPVMQCFECG